MNKNPVEKAQEELADKIRNYQHAQHLVETGAIDVPAGQVAEAAAKKLKDAQRLADFVTQSHNDMDDTAGLRKQHADGVDILHVRGLKLTPVQVADVTQATAQVIVGAVEHLGAVA